MMSPIFSPEQQARGILSTISRGDWSLAVSRLRAIDGLDRAKVATIVVRSLSPDERRIWSRYQT